MAVPTADLDLDFTTGTLPTSVALSRTGSAQATYYNSSGTLVYAPINLAFPSADFSSWTPSANATNTGASGTAPDGNNTAAKLAENNATNTHYASKNFTVVGSTQYTWSVYAKAVEDRYIQLILDDGTNGTQCNFDLTGGTAGTIGTHGTGAVAGSATITSVGSGWYRCSITSTGTSSTSARTVVLLSNAINASYAVSYTGTTGNGVLVWGQQLELGSSPSQFIYTTTVANGAPRYDYDPVTHLLRGLLIEETRSNVIQQSQSLSNWTATDTTVTANSTTSPDGTTNCSLCTEGSAGTAQLVSATASGLTAGSTISYSAYVKRGNTDWVEIIWTDNGATNGANTWFNTNTGVWGTQTARGTATISSSAVQSVGNGFYRLTITCVQPATSTTALILIRTASGDNSIVRVNGGTYYIWGAQAEVGVFPTSLIPTTTASVQRINDIVTGATGAWFTSSTTMSFAVDFTVAYRATVASGTAPVLMEIDDGTTSNLISLRLQAGATPALQSIIFVATSQTGIAGSPNTWSQNVAAKGAASFSASVINAVLNGGLSSGSAPTGLPTGLNRLVIGSGRTVPVSGWITRARYWGQVLANSDLQLVGSWYSTPTGVAGTGGVGSFVATESRSISGVAGTSGVSALGGGTFTRASSATYLDINGVIKNVGNNVMRFQNGVPLIEPAASNIVQQSVNITTPSWGTNASPNDASGTYSATVTAPDGTLTASLLVPSTGNASHTIFKAQNTGAINTLYTASAWVKAGGYNFLQFGLGNTAYPSTSAVFNLSNGTISSTSGACTATITPYNNGWYRVTHTVTSNGTGGNYIVSFGLRNNSNANVFAGDGVSGIYAWGAQVETGGTATSLVYPYTTTVTVTRAADSIATAGIEAIASGPLTGVAASSGVGTATARPSGVISGVAAASGVGGVTTETDDGITIAGVAVTSAVQPPSVTVAVAPSAATATALTGVVQGEAIEVAHVSGVGCTAAVGAVGRAVAAVPLSGSVAALAGSVSVIETVSVSGATASVQAGTVTPKLGAVRSPVTSRVDADRRVFTVTADRRLFSIAA